MYKVVIYCKSYKNDLERIKILNESVKKYNVDKIPFYVSCPKLDFDFFKNELDGINLISDEEIMGEDFEQSWYTQQLVKLNFYKTGIAENYVIVDSDSYFIRNFHYSDFIDEKGDPFFVCFEDKLFFEFLVRRNLSFVIDDTKSAFSKISSFFNRDSKILYTFGSPCIWSSKVLESLEKEISKEGRDFKEIINLSPFEMNCYGEFLLSRLEFNFTAIGPLAKVYHYQIFYDEEKLLGQSEKALSENYMMVIMQNKWVRDSVFKSSFLGSLINCLRNLSFSKNRKRIKKIKNKSFFKR
ncbi:MAG: hypothetical protein KGQ36_01295 [Rickettsiales bacterium]|nr:hypothetical protein [Rickettsiales bacterium]